MALAKAHAALPAFRDACGAGHVDRASALLRELKARERPHGAPHRRAHPPARTPRRLTYHALATHQTCVQITMTELPEGDAASEDLARASRAARESDRLAHLPVCARPPACARCAVAARAHQRTHRTAAVNARARALQAKCWSWRCC